MNQNSLQTDRKTRGHHHKLGSAIRPSFSVRTDQVLLSLPVFLCLSLYPSRDPIVVCSDGVAVKQTDPWVLTEIPISLPAISLSFRSESPSPSVLFSLFSLQNRVQKPPLLSDPRDFIKRSLGGYFSALTVSLTIPKLLPRPF